MEIESIAAIPDLDRWLAEHNLSGSWNREPGPSQPAAYPTYPPFLWKWADVREALQRIGPALDTDPELASRMAGYKHFGLNHPGVPAGRTPTINLGAQVLTPGEYGEARRHMQAEFRFIVRGGPGAYAVVEGERFPMEDGDLLVTPAWSWYDWANEGNEPVYWLNAGDISLTRLAYRFREVHPQRRQPIDKPLGYWGYAAGRTRPPWIEHELPTPPYRYPWAQTSHALESLKKGGQDPDPWDGFLLMFPHPLTGGPTSPTLALEVQLFPPRTRTEAHRHNSTTRYHVVRGEGITVVERERLEWTEKDCFIVPPWCWHQHENLGSEDAILLSVTDRPIMQALGFYREECQRTNGEGA
jgi:gentisate 1,2-dioxygenase